MAEDMRSQTAKMGTVVDSVTVVFDFQNFSLRQLYCWQVIEVVQDLLTLYECHYPETLKRAFVINAPGFFSVFWKLIRPFITKGTAGKVEIYTREGWQGPLLKCVDPSQLPVHWGGDVVGPDGDTKCSHKICIGGEVPQELYSRNAPTVSSNPKSTTRVLEPGESIEVPVSVTSAGAVLDWKFQTRSGQDIDFKTPSNSATASVGSRGKKYATSFKSTRAKIFVKRMTHRTGALDLNPFDTPLQQ